MSSNLNLPIILRPQSQVRIGFNQRPIWKYNSDRPLLNLTFFFQLRFFFYQSSLWLTYYFCVYIFLAYFLSTRFIINSLLLYFVSNSVNAICPSCNFHMNKLGTYVKPCIFLLETKLIWSTTFESFFKWNFSKIFSKLFFPNESYSSSYFYKLHLSIFHKYNKQSA